jgi:hypothetical protein
MDKDTKRLLGKLLGEVFRIQKALPIPCSASEEQIYGLLKGFEITVDDLLIEVGDISSAKVESVTNVLEPIWADSQKLNSFSGFYDIEHDLAQLGIDRGDALRILTYLKASGRFIDVIDKMNSGNSPAECKRFEVSEWER